MTVSVGGRLISEEAIAREMQNHPASSLQDARAAAARALAIRDLLLREADDLSLPPPPAANGMRRENGDEARIGALLHKQVSIPDPDEEECRRYYEQNPRRFRGADILEAAHILYAAASAEEYKAAAVSARRTLAVLQEEPRRFAAIAKAESACSSSQSGGALGQFDRAGIDPAIWRALIKAEEGAILPEPAISRHGIHILRLDRRARGRALPFAAARSQIQDTLRERAWRSALARYIAALAEKHQVRGITLSETQP